MWGKVGLTALLCVLTMGTHLLHRETISAIADVRPQRDNSLLLSPVVTQVMALGHDSLVADLFWLYTIQYYGDQMLQKKDPVHLYHYFDSLTTLDPDFEYPYIFASYVLSDTPENRKKSIALLQKGIRLNPKSWLLPYQLGFVYYIFEKNNRAAADAFTQASKIPGVAPNAANLAARLYQREGIDDCGISKDLWAEAAKSANDKDTAIRAQKHYIETTMRCDLATLNQAVKTYLAQQKAKQNSAPTSTSEVSPEPAPVRPPATPQALISSGILAEVPADPLRRAYIYQASQGKFFAEPLPWTPYELKAEHFPR